jgi:hypothetical protein
MRLLTPPSRSLQGSEVEDRLDREIDSLRQFVENEAHGQDVHEEGAHAHKPFPDRIAHRTLPPTMRFVVVLRRARHLVRRHGSDVAFYAFCIGVTLAGVWLVVSLTEP